MESLSRSSSSEGKAGFTSAGDSRRYSGAHREPQQMRVRAQGSAVARPCRQGEDLRAAAVLLSAAGGRGFVGSLGRRQSNGRGVAPRTGGERKEVHLRRGMKRGE